MAESPPDIEALSLDDVKRLVVQLLEEIVRVRSENAALRDEIARLKGLKGRPKIEPSGTEQKAAERRRTKERRKQARRGKKNDPGDGHTLREVIEETEALTGREIERAYVDKGYRGHDAPKPHRVFRSGRKRGVFGQIRRELRRRSAIEAVIGHCKTDGHLGRNFLHGRLGDQINAVMSVVGYNPRSSRGQALRLILKWLRKLLRLIIAAIVTAITPFSTLKTAS